MKYLADETTYTVLESVLTGFCEGQNFWILMYTQKFKLQNYCLENLFVKSWKVVITKKIVPQKILFKAKTNFKFWVTPCWEIMTGSKMLFC